MATYHPEEMIQANGIEICTDAFGERGDPTILLIMGASASMIMWHEPFCHALADGGRFVVRFDNRDVGRTTSCPLGEPNYNLQDMADDAVAVLDHYGVDKAHIAGASMGGMITQLVGLNHPDRVLSLTPIMSSPNPGAVTDAMEGKEAADTLSPPTQEVLEAAMSGATLDWDDKDAVLENRINMFRVLAGSKFGFDEAVQRPIFAREIERAVNFPSSQNHGLIVAGSEVWHHRLGEIDVPTLVIHGTEDPILPLDHGQAIHAGISGSTMLELEGMGHDLPDGYRDQIVAAMLQVSAG